MLTTDYCGVKLRNPVIIASCPATESIGGIKKCYENGAGAVILKSMAQYRTDKYTKIPRRVYFDKRGLWATSSFSREVLDKDNGLKLLDKCVQYGKIPIIASVAGLSYEPEGWIPLCKDVQNLGADIIQLDLFYLEQPIVTPLNFRRLIDLISVIANEIKIPIIPKLNIEIPAYLAAQSFNSTNIKGISLLDSIRVNSPISVEKAGNFCYQNIHKPGMSSVVGRWQMPITQHYLYILSKHTSMEMCAGGGLWDAKDALEMFMLGAKTVQYCAAILENGYSYITQIISDMESLLKEYGYFSVQQLYNKSLEYSSTDIQEADTSYVNMYAIVNRNNCKVCRRCINNGWCEALICENGIVRIDKDICEGCGFCTHLCKNNAIELIKREGEG